MTDSTGDWEVVGRPYTTAGGKNTHVRVQRVDKSGAFHRDRVGTQLAHAVDTGGETEALAAELQRIDERRANREALIQTATSTVS
jgi:hypothetical protein